MSASKLFEKMIGKTYLYGSENHTIKQIRRFEDDLYDVQTDKRTIRVSKSDIRKDFLPVHTPKEQTLILRQTLHIENRTVGDLAAILMKNIEKVNSVGGEKHIDQAKAINEQAKVLIDLKRLQLDIIKTAQGI